MPKLDKNKNLSKGLLPKNINIKYNHIFEIKNFNINEKLESLNIFNKSIDQFGRVLNGGFLTNYNHNIYIKSSTLQNKIKLFLSFLKKKIQQNTINIDEPLIITFDNYQNNYYHWITETLPRILLSEIDNKNTKYLFPNNLLPFQIESLKIFNNIFIQQFPNDFLVIAPKFIIPSYVGDANNHNPYFIDSIFNKTILAFNIKKDAAKNIFISRNKAKYRKITNENKLQEIAKKHNFEIAFLEDLSFVQQVELLYNTKILIAPHGAGLTNMIFMNKNCTVIELFNEDYINTCFYKLAIAKEHHYYYCVGKNESLKNKNWAWQENFYIDELEFENILSLALCQ